MVDGCDFFFKIQLVKSLSKVFSFLYSYTTSGLKELEALNNLIEQYLVFAEGQAKRRVPMYLKDWITKLNVFLTLNDREILEHAGRISHELAKEKAESKYEIYNSKRLESRKQLDSDFEKTIKRLENKKKT